MVQYAPGSAVTLLGARKKPSEWLCVREDLLQGGILCFCRKLALGNVAASFATVPDSVSQPVETRVGAAQGSCAARKEPETPFSTSWGLSL